MAGGDHHQPQVNNFFAETDRQGSSTLEFEPVMSGMNSTKQAANTTKSTKTVRDKDASGYGKLRQGQATAGSSKGQASQSNSNYQCKSTSQLLPNLNSNSAMVPPALKQAN